VSVVVLHLGFWQGEDKLRPHALGADDIDVFAVGLYDLLCDRQAEARALLVFSAGKIGLVEAVPDQFEIVFRDADSGVLYADENFIVLFGRLPFFFWEVLGVNLCYLPRRGCPRRGAKLRKKDALLSPGRLGLRSHVEVEEWR